VIFGDHVCMKNYCCNIM